VFEMVQGWVYIQASMGWCCDLQLLCCGARGSGPRCCCVLEGSLPPQLHQCAQLTATYVMHVSLPRLCGDVLQPGRCAPSAVALLLWKVSRPKMRVRSA
jgi:hypothetical protein